LIHFYKRNIETYNALQSRNTFGSNSKAELIVCRDNPEDDERRYGG